MRKQCLWVVLVSAVLRLCLAAQEKPCQPTVTGRLEVFQLASTTLQETRSVRVWLPPGYGDAANAAKKYPVLYLFDGERAFDTCTAFRHDELHADGTLTEPITAGGIPSVIAAGIDSPSASFTDKGERRAHGVLQSRRNARDRRQVSRAHRRSQLGSLGQLLCGRGRVIHCVPSAYAFWSHDHGESVDDRGHRTTAA